MTGCGHVLTSAHSVFRLVVCTMRTLQVSTTIMMNRVALTNFTPELIYPAASKKQFAKTVQTKRKVVKKAVKMKLKVTRK